MAPKRRKFAKQKEEQEREGGVSLRRFALTYLILMGAFFILIGFDPILKLIDINGLYTQAIVAITASLLSVIGIASTCRGSIIELFSISLDVKFGCNGLEAVMIYSVAVIAFPASWKKKLIGIAAGFVVIQIVNILRIVGLAYFGVHARNLFEYIHTYIAQGMMIAISLGVFFIYLNYVKSTEKVAP
ncbi:MAG: exosortase H [Pseudomonadota bacterium]